MPASSRDRSTVLRRPAVDEWGIYDPQQAGVEALMDLLEKRDAAKVAAEKSDATPEPPAIK